MRSNHRTFNEDDRRIVCFEGKHLRYLKRKAKLQGCSLSFILAQIIHNHITQEKKPQ